jgi:hypothetical protein
MSILAHLARRSNIGVQGTVTGRHVAGTVVLAMYNPRSVEQIFKQKRQLGDCIVLSPVHTISSHSYFVARVEY